MEKRKSENEKDSKRDNKKHGFKNKNELILKQELPNITS